MKSFYKNLVIVLTNELLEFKSLDFKNNELRVFRPIFTTIERKSVEISQLCKLSRFYNFCILDFEFSLYFGELYLVDSIFLKLNE